MTIEIVNDNSREISDIRVTIAEVEMITSTVPKAPPSLASQVLSRLLRMGDDYHRNQSPHQAIEVYFQLAENHDETLEGKEALSRLMGIADEYQRTGNSHMARSLYDRLMTLEDV